MHVQKLDFNGNINVGLYIYVTDDYCLVGKEVDDADMKIIEKVFKVPTHKVTIAGTSLLGVFLSGNSKNLLVPKIVFDSELRLLDKLKISYAIIDTDLTALGNNILCNDNGCLISPEFEKRCTKQIEDALGVSVKRSKVASLSTIGALGIHNKKGCLLHRDAEDFEIEMVEATLGVEATIGTVNFGSPYIRSGLVANSNGFIIGNISGGPEIQNADVALGFANG